MKTKAEQYSDLWTLLELSVSITVLKLLLKDADLKLVLYLWFASKTGEDFFFVLFNILLTILERKHIIF